MANKNKRCRNCKEYKLTESMKHVFGAYYCDIECMKDYGVKSAPKVKAKKHAEQKRKFQLTDRKARRPALKKSCHDYIRYRDKDLLCICCNEPLGDNYHAGHWLESGNNPKIRYDEDNIHAQRAYCNTYKGGDSGDYEKNLRIRIGDERVDRLLSMKGGTDKMTTDDMLKLETEFKQKLKSLKGE